MRQRLTVAAGILVLCGTVLGYTKLTAASTQQTAKASEIVFATPSKEIICCGGASGCAMYAGGCPAGTEPRACPCTPPF